MISKAYAAVINVSDFNTPDTYAGSGELGVFGVAILLLVGLGIIGFIFGDR